VVGVELQNKFVVPAKEPLKAVQGLEPPRPIAEFEWQVNKDIAYDSKMRLKAFEHAGEPVLDKKDYVQLESSSIQDEIEDVYQHLRLSFSTWLARAGPTGGASFRDKLEDILKRYDLPVFEKRKRLDIMLEGKIIKWLEPSDEEDETELGFLRVDCLAQGETGCSSRQPCVWSARQCRGADDRVQGARDDSYITASRANVEICSQGARLQANVPGPQGGHFGPRSQLLPP
jgi:hypothetical protein